MNSKIFVLGVLALVCASCQKSDDEADDGATERYTGEWISTRPGSVISEDHFALPDDLLNALKPDTVTVDTVFHETGENGSVTTKGTTLLTIKGNTATLTVNSNTTGYVDNEIAEKSYYLIFKAGTYTYDGTCEVKADGVYRERDNYKLLELDNFRYKYDFLRERKTVSSKDITVKKSFNAQTSTANGGELLFSKNDTTFRATKEDGGYFLEMFKPSENDFYNHTMDRR